MTDPLVVLVLVVASGAGRQSEPGTPSMTAAARQALGANTVLLVEEQTALPTDDEALGVAEHVRATAVVELEWAAQRSTAVLRVHTTERSGWAQRTIDFAPNEAAAEYGRTLGFAMASMITGLGVPASVMQSEPPAKAEPSPAAPNPEVSSRTDARAASAERAEAPAAPPPTRYHVLEAAMVVAGGLGSDSDSLGPSLRASAPVLPWLAVRLDAGLRFGSISAAGATFTSLQLGGGATWPTFFTSGPRPFELDVCADFFANELLVYRAGASRSRWLPEASVSVEAVWYVITRNIGVSAATGLDASFGTTTVAVGNDSVARISPVHALGVLGLRMGF
jgi:hypothetical protein